MIRKVSRLGVTSGCASSYVMFAALFASQGAVAHGFIASPPERAEVCRQTNSELCGNARYEPHSVGEEDKGFPQSGGLQDGKMGGGNNPNFDSLNLQSAARWTKTELKTHDVKFAWEYTMGHLTTKHEYFVTKNGWNANAPLTRDSFDLNPFCVVDKGAAYFPTGSSAGSGSANEAHDCQIPADRTGYHVIMGVWTVDNTAKSFHKVMDVDIQAEAERPDGWRTAGSIATGQTLLRGDKVKARAFDAAGAAMPQFDVEVNIDNDEEGKPDNWSFKLAEQINKTQDAKLVQAGVRGADDKIKVIKGANNVFAQTASGIKGYQLETTIVEDAEAKLKLAPMEGEHTLENGRMTLTVPVEGNRKMNVKVSVIDADKNQIGSTSQLVDGSAALSVDVRTAPGAHTIELSGTTVDGRTSRLDQQVIEIGGEASELVYDNVWPEGISSYQQGTTVLQAKDEKVYECKVAGWCANPHNFYEPGVGHYWGEAWKLK